MRPLLILCSILLCSSASLKKADVRETFEEMLHLHVEHAEISPLLIKRAFKIFLEQFDANKIYFLDSEVQAVAQASKKKLESGVNQYRKDDLSNFKEINHAIGKAIKRTR